MVFSAKQKQQFDASGYVVQENFFTPREIEALLAELDRFQREGLVHNVTTEGDGATHSNKAQNLQVIPLYDKSRLYRALPFHPKVVEAITELIGEPAMLHLDQIFLKPAQHGRGTSWHQDNYYFGLEDPTKGIGMWIALHDATEANGTMNLVPGHGTEMLPHRRDPYSDHHSRCDPDEEKAIAVEVAAGGALFFNYAIPHCTRANTTDKDRAGLAIHFLRKDHTPENINRVGEHPRPLINGPEASGGEREYGRKIAGTWEKEVEHVLGGATSQA